MNFNKAWIQLITAGLKNANKVFKRVLSNFWDIISWSKLK